MPPLSQVRSEYEIVRDLSQLFLELKKTKGPQEASLDFMTIYKCIFS